MLMSIRFQILRCSSVFHLRLLICFLLPAVLLMPERNPYRAAMEMEALREHMGDPEQAVLSVRQGLVSRDSVITISFSSEEQDMSFVPDLVKNLMKAALAETSSPVEGDYIRFQYGGYSVEYVQSRTWGGLQYTLNIEPIYYTTAEQEKKTDDKVAEILTYLNLSPDLPDSEKIRAVFDYLWKNISYDKAHMDDEEYHLRATAYASLVNRTAVCQGYSVTLHRLLKELGFSCRIVTGTVIGENDEPMGHAWNIVKLGDLYYNLDVTWASNLGEEAYFLQGEGTFTDHIRDEDYSTAEFMEAYPMAWEDF